MKPAIRSHVLLLFLCCILFLFPALSGAEGPSPERKRPILCTVHKSRPKSTSQQGRTGTVSNNINNSSLSSLEKTSFFPALLKKISARSAIVLDAGTGEELFAYNINRPAQPASTIKVLTGLIAIRNLDHSELVPVSRRAARMPRSKVYLDPGRSYRANTLIDAVLLASANDASVALAEEIAGSEGEFARLMTDTARQMGARSTVCKTASGLTARGQQTTVQDLAIIFNTAMADPEFARRIQRPTMKGLDGNTIRNHNRALWQISGTLGGKTGYTHAARQTYVGKFSRNGREIVVALLGSNSMWEDISSLVEYGFSQQEKGQRTATRTADRPDPTEPAAPARDRVSQL